MVPRTRDHFFGQFWKLGFFSLRECQIFAHGGQLRILLDRECVASVPTWNMPKISCTTYQKPILMDIFHSMPRVGIQQVSLKACRRWDSTFHRMMTVTQIDGILDLLDSRHQDSARGGPLLWVHGQWVIF